MTRSRETGDVGYRAYKKNYLINGGMSEWQRGNAVGLILGTVYGPDRFYVYSTGAVTSPVQKIPNAATPAGTAMTSFGAVGNTNTAYGQRIEAQSAGSLKGATVTLSAQVSTSDSRQVSLALSYANAENNFATTTTIGTVATTAAIGFRLVEATFEIPDIDAIRNGIEVGIAFGAVGSGVQVAAADVQLEEGSTATEFEYVSPAENLASCQRYYLKVNPINITLAPIFNSTTSIERFANIMFPSTMRAVPDTDVTETVPADWVVQGKAISPWGFYLQGTPITETTVLSISEYTADAEL